LIDRQPGFAIVTSLVAPPGASPVVIEGFTLDPNPAEARKKYTSCPNGVYICHVVWDPNDPLPPA
jgi:hypothetical protein